MDAIGLIAEWNPFHKGHAFLIDAIRQSYPDEAIMAVMSGPFTQRAEPALVGKWCRTEMALAQGVDLVFELPQCFAAASLETFAQGGVETLLATGSLKALAFGSEGGNEAALRHTAGLLKTPPPQFETYIKEALAQGIPYGPAVQRALIQIGGAEIDLRSRPNDRLGAHYVRHLPANFPLVVVKRGLHHPTDDIRPQTLASASQIRQRLRQEEPVARYLPESSHFLLAKEKAAGWVLPWVEMFFPLWRAQIAGLGARGLALAWQIDDGWPERCVRAMATAQTFATFLDTAQTRHYTRSRIQRLLLSLLAPIKRSGDLSPPYLRVLGFSPRGRSLLKGMHKKADVPILGNLGRDSRLLSPEAAHILGEDVARQDLAACLQQSAPFSNWGRDYREAPRLGTWVATP